MPNFCVNVVTFGSKADLQKALTFSSKGRQGEDDYILDLDKLIPMPKSLDIVSGSTSDSSYGAYCYLAGKDTPERKRFLSTYENNKEPGETVEQFLARVDGDEFMPSLALGKQIAENLRLYGVPTWFEWRIEHWGTKWNTWGGALLEDGIVFYTAWSCPVPALLELSKHLANEMTVMYSEEGDPAMTTVLTIDHGEVVFSAEEVAEPEGDEEYGESLVWNVGGEPFKYKEEPIAE